MKIAIFDPEPSACGLMAWTRHLQSGFRALGHECDVVSLTVSGRPRKAWGTAQTGTMWYNRPLDAVGAFKDCAAFFQQYDRVVLTTPEIGIQDKEAKKNNWLMPKYLLALERAGVPFTTALQGFDYGEKWSPFAADLVSLPNFTGAGVAHSPTSIVLNGNTALEKVTWLNSGLPYTPVMTENGPIPPRGSAGVTGRFCHIKGFHLMVIMAGAGMLPRDTYVNLNGTCAVSNRPSISHESWEMLKDDYGFGMSDLTDHFHPIPWIGVNPDTGITVQYTGMYTEPVPAAGVNTVNVTTTAVKNCSGTMDYSQLESIDAGCVMVSSETQWLPCFKGFTIDPLESMPTRKAAMKDALIQDWLRDDVARTVGNALAMTDEQRYTWAAHNRQVLREDHSPRNVAAKFVEALSG